MKLRARLSAISVALVAATLAPAPTHAAPAPLARTSPLSSSFYTYSGSTPLRDLKLGTVLKTRTVSYSIQGLALPLKATQILYRTRNQVGHAVVDVTTVVRPLTPVAGTPKVLSYQSFYDSLNPADEPSAAIAGGSGLGVGNANVETLIFAPALLAGYTINIPDTEGQTADFAAGPEYGYTTLDSLRAISHSSATGVGTRSKIGLLGYSGGAIASEWAAELAPTYARGVARRLVGTAIGGVLVHPGHNLHYVQGSAVWAGVMPMALVGLARAFHIDLAQYANDYGRSVMTTMQKAPISTVLGMYPGLTWKKIAKARYAQPEQIPVYVRTANKLIMGRFHTPTAPMFIGQGNGGILEGTSPSKVYGAGDGVMIAGDVRTLAREYCRRGVTVKYTQYPLSHFTSVTEWLPAAYGWITARFAGKAAPSSCGSIARGNSLAPLKLQG
ncbi:MAG TPA: lipase family protein [Nocardioides sp.]|nr:lipase family protein [Nocardioides sp.]